MTRQRTEPYWVGADAVQAAVELLDAIEGGRDANHRDGDADAAAAIVRLVLPTPVADAWRRLEDRIAIATRRPQ